MSGEWKAEESKYQVLKYQLRHFYTQPAEFYLSNLNAQSMKIELTFYTAIILYNPFSPGVIDSCMG